jgi:tetratricopeptide (TPR) repeat protein
MRDDFNARTKEALARRVGYRCSNPDCRKLTSGPHDDPMKFVNIGVAAHITAAAEGGPRYDPSLSSEERSSVDNGIWLCQDCAHLIDIDVQRYTVELLREWKRQAEERAQDEIEGRTRYPSSPKAAPRPFQLPPELPTFTGRETYLAELDELLQPGAGRTVSLVGLRGTAGVGKSALAVHAAHRWGDRFRDGVVWVDLRQRDVTSALRHVAATYGYGDQAAQTPDPEGLAALVRSALRGREGLIILDNAEGVPPQEFPLLLPGVEGCVTLVTSRRSFTELRRYGQVLRVGEMTQDEAEALLARILGEAADEEEQAARGKLAERLGYLPQALDIAARLMAERGWSSAGYLAQLEGAPNLVAELCLPLAERPEDSVALAFALSYQALNEAQQRLFRAVGVMAEGGFAPLAVAWVLEEAVGQVERGLEDLAALSLVRPGSVRGRYELHTLVASYSRTLAREAGERERLRAAHLGYYVTYAERYTDDYGALETELPNLMAAGEWAREKGENEEVRELAEWLYASGVHFLDLRGYVHEAVRLLSWAVEAARAMGDRRGKEVWLGNLGNAYAALGEVRRAIAYYEQALEIAHEIGDRRGEGNALGNLGNAYADLGEVRRAIETFEAALEIAREIGDRRGEGNHLGNLGSAYYRLGEVRRAIECHEAALEISRETGDRGGEGTDLGSLGIAYAALGEVQRAIKYYEQALEIARGIGDRRREEAWQGNLGLAYAALGEVRQAIEYHEQALEIAREIGDRRGEGAALGSLGLAYVDLGEVRRAIEYYEQALEIAREIGDRHGKGATLGNLGNAYAALGEVRRAIEYYEQALEIAHEIGDRRNEGAWLGNLGLAYADLGEVRRAIAYYEQALEIAREIGDRRAEGADLGNLGMVYKNLGDSARARELWEQALHIFEAIEDPNAELVRGWLAALEEGDVDVRTG